MDEGFWKLLKRFSPDTRQDALKEFGGRRRNLSVEGARLE